MHCFHFIAGFLRTNYEEYTSQYRIDGSIIVAPAMGGVSALLTIHAPCHLVINLSNTLPTFTPGKKMTCKAHGIRTKFLEGVDVQS
jgi:hypothetical protein